MDIFETISYWLSQAYIYIPSILAAISAIGFPAIVQIAKIFCKCETLPKPSECLIKET